MRRHIIKVITILYCRRYQHVTNELDPFSSFNSMSLSLSLCDDREETKVRQKQLNSSLTTDCLEKSINLRICSVNSIRFIKSTIIFPNLNQIFEQKLRKRKQLPCHHFIKNTKHSLIIRKFRIKKRYKIIE